MPSLDELSVEQLRERYAGLREARSGEIGGRHCRCPVEKPGDQEFRHVSTCARRRFEEATAVQAAIFRKLRTPDSIALRKAKK